MVRLFFSKGFVNDSQLDRDEVLSVALAITDNALSHWNIKNHLDTVGKRFEKAFINYCDIDRIYLSLDAEATPDSYADFIIRTWDYHISEEDSNALRIDWTFHCMGESSSAEHCDGSHDILIFGKYDGLNENVTNKDQLARLEAAAHSNDGGLSNQPSIRMHRQRTTRWYIKWFQTMCDNPDLCGIDEPDDEMRVLSIVKNCQKDVVNQFSDGDLCCGILDDIKKYVSTKFRTKWFKNYCDELDDMDNFVPEFLYHRLKTGHTEREDRFTLFMRDYPMDVLTWLDDALPAFYHGLAEGNDYVLIGLSKETFLKSCHTYNWRDVNYYGLTYYADFEYAEILERKYGADFAADYLKAIRAELSLAEFSDYSFEKNPGHFVEYMEELATKCDDDFLLSQLLIYYADKDVNRSIEYASKLAEMRTAGLISEEWINDALERIFMNLRDMNSGDDDWFEEFELERNWLLKLLKTDFSSAIADLLTPFLTDALKVIREYNKWPEGVQAIEAFLNR